MRVSPRVLVAGAVALATLTPTAIAAGAPAITVPSYPTSLQAGLNYDGTSPSGTITASWQPPASDGGSPVTGYVVELDSGAVIQHLPPDALATSFGNIALGAGHSVFIYATNANGSGSNVGRYIDQRYFAPSPAPYPIELTGDLRAGTTTLRWTSTTDNGGLPFTYRVTVDGVDLVRTTDTATTVATSRLGDPGLRHDWSVFAENAAGSSSLAAYGAYALIPSPGVNAVPTSVYRGSAATVTASLAWSDTWRQPVQGTFTLVREGTWNPVAGPVPAYIWPQPTIGTWTHSDGVVQVPVPDTLWTGRYQIYYSGDPQHGVGPAVSSAVITVVPPTPVETLSVHKRTARYGSGFRLSVLRSYRGVPLPDQLVNFYYVLPGQRALHRFASVLTDRAGIARAAFTPNRNVTFVAATQGDGIWAATRSASVSTTTFNAVSVALSRPAGHRATLTANVAPATRLILQRSTDRVHWTTVAAVSGSKASWPVSQTSRTQFFRVVASATARTVAAGSRVLALPRY